MPYKLTTNDERDLLVALVTKDGKRVFSTEQVVTGLTIQTNHGWNYVLGPGIAVDPLLFGLELRAASNLVDDLAPMRFAVKPNKGNHMSEEEWLERGFVDTGGVLVGDTSGLEKGPVYVDRETGPPPPRRNPGTAAEVQTPANCLSCWLIIAILCTMFTLLMASI